MVAEDKKIKKACSFYVSDFHLEMILLPYINEKIDKNENISILTEKNLKNTIEVLISKTNLKEENKERILSLGWNGEKNLKEKSNIIIIGTEKYIKEKNEEIKNTNPSSIIDCYDFEEVKDKMNNIINEYEMSLNTSGNNKF